MKKIVSILISIVMLVSSMPITTVVEAASIWDVDFAYQTISVSEGETFEYKMMVTSNTTGFTDVSFASVYSSFAKKGFTITGIKSGSLISSDKMSVGVNYDNIQISGVEVGANVIGDLFTLTLKAPTGLTKNTTYTIPVSISKVARGSYNLDVDTISGSITVNASSAAATYTVSYNAGAGTGAPDNQTKEAGINLTLASSPIPTREGYDFKGWDTSSAAQNVVYSLGGTYSEDKNVSLYAVWSPKVYYISFDANGGMGAPSRVEKTHNNPLTLPTTVPTKEGYVFKGWATSSSSTTVAYVAGGSFTENKTTTLYAVYSVKNYYIRYDLNGGTSAAIPEQGKINNVDTNITSTIPTREGYDFLGWSKDKSANSATYAAGAKYSENVDNYLYAVWKLKTYSVTYDANGGNDAPASQTKKYFDNLILSSTKPTREGYVFKGWATSKTATTATVQSGATYSTNENVTYYAVWSPMTYTVSYDANGGENAPSAQTKKYFDNLTLSTTKPTRTGYNFLGWATSKTATKTEYQAGATYTKNERVTLYAVWSIITYSVTYDAKGGSNGPGAQTKEYGKTLTLSSTKPTKTGCTFQGWTTTDGSTIVNYASGALYTDNETLKLYAVWRANTYTVSFDANGGTNAPASQTKTYGTSLTLSSTVPTRSGYTFKGWGTSSTSTTVSAKPGDTYTANNPMTYYAIWEKVSTYTVSYDANGGSNAPDSQIKSAGQSLKLSTVVPTKEGHSFQGWAKTKGSTSVDYASGATYTTDSNVTLYAVWKADTYSVSYDANGGSNAPSAQTKTYGQNLTLSNSVPTRTGYDFQGWGTSASASTVSYKAGAVYTTNAKITLYAIWTIKTYTVSYDSKGGSNAPASQTKEYGKTLTLSSSKPTKTGYTFQGWTTTDGSTTVNYAAGASYTGNASLKLYAVWKDDTYSVSYDANGGSNAPSAQTKTYGQNLTLSTSVPTRTGYDFQGWGTSATTSTVAYKAGAVYTTNAKITLYAIWTPKTYDVTYDTQGGTNGPANQSKEYDKELTLSSIKPTKEGYTFQGWTKTAGSSVVDYAPAASYTDNASLKLYAVWKVITYTVTYNANGGSNAPSAQTKTYGQNLTLSTSVPTRTGYDFQGWGTSATTTTVTYKAGATYTTNAKITLYAIWTIKTYTVSYDSKGGSNGPAAQTKEYGKTLTLSSTKPTKTGYTFQGWTTTDGSTIVNYAAGASYTGNASLKLYAVWKIITYTVSYDANGGNNAPSAQTKTYGQTLTLSLDKPTRYGYGFIGWTKTKGSDTAEYASGAGYTDNSAVTLYAVWKPNPFTVSYDANGGDGAPTSQVKLYDEDLTLSSKKPTRTGYTFQGWAISKDSTAVDYLPGTVYSEENDVTLYAVWKADTYTVSYNANGGNNAPSAQVKTYGQNLTLSSSVPTRTGYDFQGWGTSATTTTVAYKAGATYTTNSKITLYAIWKLKTYTVGYDANGGNNAPSAQIKTYGQNLSLSSSVPTRTGYDFQGWGTSATASTVSYKAGATYTTNAKITLYAIWSLKTYTVNYDANGGDKAPEAGIKEYGKDYTVIEAEVVREGYKFLGWNTNKEAATASMLAGDVFTDNTDLTLYAIFEKLPCNEWIYSDGNWYYYGEDYKAIVGWKQISGTWFYFKEDATMTTGWLLIGGRYYYFNKNGYMVTGWLNYANTWYYLNSNGDMRTGWLLSGGKYYYLRNDGSMATGWVKDGKYYYYMNTDGSMKTGWLLEGTKYYYLEKSGEMVTGWKSIDNIWYYFSDAGDMATGWKLISGSWYYFTSDGTMISGKSVRLSGKVYTFNSQGVCVNP